MALKIWRGDAPAVAQVTRLTPADVAIGKLYTVTINGKSITVTATVATVAHVVTLLVAAIGDSAIPEFQEITAEADTGNTAVVLTANTPGMPFVVTTADPDGAALGVSVTTLQTGSGGANAVQSFSVPLSGTGTFRIWFGDQVTAPIAIGASAATVKTALELLSTVGGGNTSITKTDSALSDYTTYAVTFVGTFSGFAVADLFVRLIFKSPWIITVQDGSRFNPVLNEIQTIRYPDTLTNGFTSTLTLDGQNTGALDLTQSASVLKAAIEGLANVESASVTKADRTFTVEFLSIDGSAAQSALTASPFSGIPDDAAAIYYIDVTNTPPATTATNEQQVVALTGLPTGGTFTLTYSGQTTSAIAFDASAATVDAALEALSNIGAGDVVVTGSAGGPWTVEFQTALAATDVPLMTGDGASLTGGNGDTMTVTNTVPSSGPNHWDTPANWLPSGVPVSGDAVRFEIGNSDCLYGLDQTGITLLSLYVAMSWTGKLGLPRNNLDGYLEYRTTELTCGVTTLLVGYGEGSGPGKVAVNTLAVQSSVEVRGSGGSSDIGIPAVIWRGTHAANSVRILNGDFGTAPYSDQSCVIDTFHQFGGIVAIRNTNVITEALYSGQQLSAFASTINGKKWEA